MYMYREHLAAHRNGGEQKIKKNDFLLIFCMNGVPNNVTSIGSIVRIVVSPLRLFCKSAMWKAMWTCVEERVEQVLLRNTSAQY